MAWIAWTDRIYSASVVTGAHYSTPSDSGFVTVDVRSGAVVGGFEMPIPVQVDAIGPPPVPLGPTPDGDRAVKWRRTLRVGRRVER